MRHPELCLEELVLIMSASLLGLCNTPDVGKEPNSLLAVHRFCSGLIQADTLGLVPFVDSRALGIELLFEDFGCLC